MHIRWFSRPSLPPLGLDLADFRARGTCQFGGRTSEGRAIYARYRMGCLTVKLEDPEEVLLKTCIGPAYHGSMILEQVCDLAGMTIKGRSPIISAEMLEEAQNHEPVLDWSGRTTYWQPQVELTSHGIASLTDVVNNADSHYNISLSMQAFYRNASVVDPMLFDRPTLLAETTSGTLFVNFPSDRPEDRVFFENLASRYLFNRIDIIDLATGAVMDTREAGVCYSRDLIDWCAAGADRYITAHLSGEPSQMIGIRPAQDVGYLFASR